MKVITGEAHGHYWSEIITNLFIIASKALPSSSKCLQKARLKTMDINRAKLICEQVCYTGSWNMIYSNEPTFQDCIEAQCTIHCGLFADHSNICMTGPHFLLTPSHFQFFPPLAKPILALVISHSASALTQKEQAIIHPQVLKFRDIVWLAKKGLANHHYTPASSFLTSIHINSIIDQLMEIKTKNDLKTAIPDWSYHEQHSAGAIALIDSLCSLIKTSHEAAHLECNEKSQLKQAATMLAKQANKPAPQLPQIPLWFSLQSPFPICFRLLKMQQMLQRKGWDQNWDLFHFYPSKLSHKVFNLSTNHKIVVPYLK